MLAVDTNVVVRFLTGDDADQASRARALIETESVLLLNTVALETEWVLRSGYGMDSREVVAGLRAFAGLANVTAQEPAQLAQALDWADRGLDFADALHLAGASNATGFVTFDRKLARTSARFQPGFARLA